MVKSLPANAGDIIDVGSIPRSGRSPGEGNGNPLQYPCLENSINRGAWWATVHGVTKSQDWSNLAHIPRIISVYQWSLSHFIGSSEVKASACNAEDLGSIPGSGRSPGEGKGNPLQYSCLENPIDGGAWWLQSMGSQRVGHDWATMYMYIYYSGSQAL